MTVNGGVNKSNLSEVSYVSGVTSYNTAKSHTGISFSAQDNSNGIRNGNKAFVYGIKY
jgi:hypothetical protein